MPRQGGLGGHGDISESKIRNMVAYAAPGPLRIDVVEENTQVALWRCVGVKAPLAPAIFSGTRIETATSYI